MAQKAEMANGTGGNETEVDFAKIPLREAFNLLNSSSHGLTEEEAQKRLEEFGPNKLPETSVNPVLRFLGYLWNPLSWAMEVAAILAIILLDYADFALIVALLLLNAVISYVEESNADKAIKALAGALAPKCKVLRSGKVRTMDAVDIVPGDVLMVRLGDIVPADIKLLGDEHAGEEGDVPMQIDQAALTGESLPAKKFTGDVAFSGSTIKQGERHAVVYATGVNTFFGRAAALIGATNNVANIQKVMTKIGAVCLITIGVWVVIELGVQFGAYNHSCYTGVDECPTLTNLLVIIVGGIPIAMPTVLSVTLALGAYQLAKHGAIVARMSAVEEMAGMDILCSDKTGTLTLNKLSIDLAASFPMSGMDVNSLVKYAALSADIVGEEAIDLVLHNTYPDKDNLWTSGHYKRLKFIPFNPVDKFTMAVVQEERTGKVFRLMKGAPQVVLKRAHNFSEIHEVVEQKIIEYANRGYRALGFGLADGNGGADTPGTHWEFLGLLPLFDPPRHDTAETIQRCLTQGIQVKMVTGDQQLIGAETARQLGMGTNIHKIEVLLKAKGSSGLVNGHSSVEELVENADGFAEVFPEHKYEIVKMLQDRHHMVGMTGDGVNDAPALKKADVGIAVHGATEAARGAADIVLTEPGLSVIVEAVIGARKIFQRMTTYAKYTVAMTFRICFTFGILTIAYNWYFPTILIVLLAVFNDGAMIALSKDRVTPSPTPNAWRLRDIFLVGIAYGLYLTLSTWVLYHVASKTTFFERRCHMYSLNDTDGELIPFCTNLLASRGITNVGAPASQFTAQLGQQYAGISQSVLDQCLVEQRFARGAQLRTLIYNQVSISGQALVFVVRTASYSLLSLAGGFTYIAFFGAQIASTLIAAFGFGGYPLPPGGIYDCSLCANSQGWHPQFWPRGFVPVAGSEGRFVASVIGCTYYVVVAWIWSMIWYLGLDPLKWLLMWIFNEDGFRNRRSWKKFRRARGRPPTKTGEENYITLHGAAANHLNPMGRASMQRPDAHTLSRASVISVEVNPQGLRRVSAPSRRSSGEMQSHLAGLAAQSSLYAGQPFARTSMPRNVQLARMSPGTAAAAGVRQSGSLTSGTRGAVAAPAGAPSGPAPVTRSSLPS